MENQKQDNSNRVKILFRTPAGEVETLWATPQGGDLYQLDNNPIDPYGVSAEDIVEAIFDKDEERKKFVRVVKKSGNKTVRIIFETKVEESKEAKAILDRLVEMGCDYEGLNQKHFSINIPPKANFKELCDCLTALKCQWEYGDPSYEVIYGKKKWWWPF